MKKYQKNIKNLTNSIIIYLHLIQKDLRKKSHLPPIHFPVRLRHGRGSRRNWWWRLRDDWRWLGDSWRLLRGQIHTAGDHRRDITIVNGNIVAKGRIVARFVGRYSSSTREERIRTRFQRILVVAIRKVGTTKV